jgi:hypothetical protein
MGKTPKKYYRIKIPYATTTTTISHHLLILLLLLNKQTQKERTQLQSLLTLTCFFLVLYFVFY